MSSSIAVEGSPFLNATIAAFAAPAAVADDAPRFRRCSRPLLSSRLVTYADPAIAEAAIEQLNNAELGGRPIHIRLDRKEVEASGGFPGENAACLRGAGGLTKRVMTVDRRRPLSGRILKSDLR